MTMVRITDLLDLDKTLAKDYLQGFDYPWQALAGLSEYIASLAQSLEDYEEPAEGVFVHPTAVLAENVVIQPPCIIGPNTEVRPGAFLRGGVLIGAGCVVGNSTEVKNAILFDGVQVPHFNYIGDSILGYKAHFGAGSVTSNVRGDKQPVVIHAEQAYPTGRKKVGAFVGDFGEIGCNAVLNPGTVIGRNSQVYPTACVRGVVPERCIYKNNGTIVKKDND